MDFREKNPKNPDDLERCGRRFQIPMTFSMEILKSRPHDISHRLHWNHGTILVPEKIPICYSHGNSHGPFVLVFIPKSHRQFVQFVQPSFLRTRLEESSQFFNNPGDRKSPTVFAYPIEISWWINPSYQPLIKWDDPPSRFSYADWMGKHLQCELTGPLTSNDPWDDPWVQKSHRMKLGYLRTTTSRIHGSSLPP